jgi:hypothetical protein
MNTEKLNKLNDILRGLENNTSGEKGDKITEARCIVIDLIKWDRQTLTESNQCMPLRIGTDQIKKAEAYSHRSINKNIMGSKVLQWFVGVSLFVETVYFIHLIIKQRIEDENNR